MRDEPFDCCGNRLAVGLPVIVGYENVGVTPLAGRPWLTEEYVPATSTIRTTSRDRGHGETTGLYIVTYYGRAGDGITAIRRRDVERER